MYVKTEFKTEMWDRKPQKTVCCFYVIFSFDQKFTVIVLVTTVFYLKANGITGRAFKFLK